MKAAVAVCDTCTLSECDIYHRSCQLRATKSLVKSAQYHGEPVEPALLAAAREWTNETFIDWCADRSERRARVTA